MKARLSIAFAFMCMLVVVRQAVAGAPPQPPGERDKVIEHVVGNPNGPDNKVGSFLYIERTTFRVHIITTPAAKFYLIPPGDLQPGSYFSETVWRKVADGPLKNWYRSTPIPGKRVNALIKGHYGMVAEGQGGQGGQGGQPVEPPVWTTMSVDLDMDADTNRDGPENLNDPKKDVVEDRDETQPEHSVLVASGERAPLRLRQVLPVVPQPRPVGTVKITRQHLAHFDVVFKGTDTSIFKDPENDLVSEDLWARVKDAECELEIVGKEILPYYVSTLTAEYKSGSLVFTDIIKVAVVMDLDIDSDNTGVYDQPSRGPDEDKIENDPNKPGKFVMVNAGDLDGDGIPDFADGFDLDGQPRTDDDRVNGQRFVPLVLQASGVDFDIGKATFRVLYSGSDPTKVQVGGAEPNQTYTPAPGHLRIWRYNSRWGLERRNPAPANAKNNPGDYVAPNDPNDPNSYYTYSQLLVGQYIPPALYVEGIAASAAQGDQRIVVEIDPDGPTGPAKYVVSDAVRVTVLRLDLDVNGNKSLADAVDGAVGFLPGNEGATRKVSTGLTFNAPNYTGQKMKVVLDGLGQGGEIDQVLFKITGTTTYDGFCENATDAKITGADKNDDYSFAELANDREEPGTMEAAKTWADLWCKDYGGQCNVEVSLRKGGKTVLVLPVLRLPLNRDGDKLADRWEREKVREWNSQYGESRRVNESFFGDTDDKEPRDPDANNTDGGTDLPKHDKKGDKLTAFQEYRGFILDGGGHDWTGGNSHPGGHGRMSPAFKELLVEVDAMTGPAGGHIAAMPGRAGIIAWMDGIASGYSQRTDGTGLRLYYALDDLATAHTHFPGGLGDLEAYALARINPRLTRFCHLQLIDDVAGEGSSGWGWQADGAGAVFAVTSGSSFAASFGIPVATCAMAYISHELHHTIISETGDYNEHFNDTDGDGRSGTASDKLRELWNYRFNYASQTKRTTAAVGAGDVVIPVNNTNNLTNHGIVRIGAEDIEYTGITPNSLTGCVRGAGAVAHARGAAVVPRYSGEEMKQTQFGNGTVKYIDIPRRP